MTNKIRRISGLQLFDKGISMGSELTAQDIDRGIKLEEHAQVLDRYLETTDGTYGWQGLLPRGGTLTVPKASLKDSITHAERVERVRRRINSDKAPELISWDPATDTPIFAEEDMEAYQDGFICPSCCQYQAVPHAPKCNWNRSAPVDTDEEMGCGHVNYTH